MICMIWLNVAAWEKYYLHDLAHNSSVVQILKHILGSIITAGYDLDDQDKVHRHLSGVHGTRFICIIVVARK